MLLRSWDMKWQENIITTPEKNYSNNDNTNDDVPSISE